MLFTVKLATPLPEGAPTGYVVLDSTLDGVRFSTALPGGFAGCDLSINSGDAANQQRGYLPMFGDVRPFGHLEISSGGALIYAGRIIQTEKPGGIVQRVVCSGYGLSAMDDDYWSSADTTPITAGPLLQQVLSVQAPLITIASSIAFVDTGVTHTGLEFDGQTPGYILSQLVTEGGNLNVVWDYAVYERQILTFQPRAAPAVPDYVIPFDGDVTWSEEYQQMWGGASVSYSDSGLQAGAVLATVGGQTPSVSSPAGAGTTFVTPVTTNPAFAVQWGISSPRRIRVQGGTMSAAAAVQYRDTLLSSSAAPQVSAKVQRQGGRMMETASGGLIPAYLVRAGQWVQVGDQAPLCVIQTDTDILAETTTIELGQPSPNLPNVLASLIKNVATMAAGHNVKTAARQLP